MPLMLGIKCVKDKWYESMYTIGLHFIMFNHYTWNGFEGCVSHIKTSGP